MKGILQFQFALLIIAGLIPLGCNTPQPQHDKPLQTQLPLKTSGAGRAVEASPALERFLISHGFHREERQIYTRQYRSRKEAGEDLGVSLVNLPIPPNGTILTERDERVFMLHGWDFTVLAEKGWTLDDSSAPCIVGTSLIQVR